MRLLAVFSIVALFSLAGNGGFGVSSAQGGVINNSVTWGSQPTSNQAITKANAGTIVQNSQTINVGWQTGYGKANVNVYSGTIANSYPWNVLAGTNFFPAGETPTQALFLGFDTDNDTTNNTAGSLSATNLQKITFSSPITNPYLYFSYVQYGAIYDLSAYTGATMIDGSAVNFTNGLLTSTINAPDVPGFSAIIGLTGTFSQISFNINASAYSFTHAISYLTIAAPVTATPSPSSSVPEPTSLAISGLGALCVALRARRKRTTATIS